MKHYYWEDYDAKQGTDVELKIWGPQNRDLRQGLLHNKLGNSPIIRARNQLHYFTLPFNNSFELSHYVATAMLGAGVRHSLVGEPDL